MNIIYLEYSKQLIEDTTIRILYTQKYVLTPFERNRFLDPVLDHERFRCALAQDQYISNKKFKLARKRF